MTEKLQAPEGGPAAIWHNPALGDFATRDPGSEPGWVEYRAALAAQPQVAEQRELVAAARSLGNFEGAEAMPNALRVALEDLDAMESLGPTTEAVIDAAQRWYLAGRPAPAEHAPIYPPVRICRDPRTGVLLRAAEGDARAAFEAWARDEWGDKQWPDNAWLGFQAGYRAQPQPKGPRADLTAADLFTALRAAGECWPTGVSYADAELIARAALRVAPSPAPAHPAVAALERLQRFDFECRRDGLEPLPANVVKIIDDALTGQAPAVGEQAAPGEKKDFDIELFTRRFRACAEMRGKSMKDVSAETGVSETTLSRMRNEGRKPDAASLAALSAWAGINPAECVKPADSSPPVQDPAS